MLRALPIHPVVSARIRAGGEFKHLFDTRSKVLVRKTTRCALSETQTSPPAKSLFRHFDSSVTEVSIADQKTILVVGVTKVAGLDRRI
jgi:hypothetical protein